MAGEVENVKTGKILEVTRFDKFVTTVKDLASIDNADGLADDLSRDQVEGILTAETIEDLDKSMEFSGLRGLKDIEDGTVFQINDFRYVKSGNVDYKNAFETYAIMQVQYEDGHEEAIDTNVERVITYLYQARKLGLLPIKRRVSKRRTTGGNEMITLLPVK